MLRWLVQHLRDLKKIHPIGIASCFIFGFLLAFVVDFLALHIQPRTPWVIVLMVIASFALAIVGPLWMLFEGER
jgi:hypothetical protein